MSLELFEKDRIKALEASRCIRNLFQQRTLDTAVNIIGSFGSEYLKNNYRQVYDQLEELTADWSLCMKYHFSCKESAQDYVKNIRFNADLLGGMERYIQLAGYIFPLIPVEETLKRYTELLKFIEDEVIPRLPAKDDIPVERSFFDDKVELSKEEIFEGGVEGGESPDEG